jgi:hypothetical protein
MSAHSGNFRPQSGVTSLSKNPHVHWAAFTGVRRYNLACLSEEQIRLCYDYASEQWPFDLGRALSESK